MIEKAKQVLKETIMTGAKMTSEAVDILMEEIPIKVFKKGDILLHQGDEPHVSFYVITGCVRQYLTDEQGKETTVDFYLESSSINMLSYADDEGLSRYGLSCVEASALVVCPHFQMSDLQEMEANMREMIQNLFYTAFTQLQSQYALFKLMSPEERFLYLMEHQMDLMKRVPQHMLASYLDITPETYSRFKKKHMSKSMI